MYGFSMPQLLEKKYRQVFSKIKTKNIIAQKTERKICLLLLVIPFVSSIVFFGQNVQNESQNLPLKSAFVIQNLRGDITNTWLSWDLVEGRVLQIQIVNDAYVSAEKISAIKNSIDSTETVEIDDSILHKGLSGSSVYYKGWKGAVRKAAQTDTKYYIPTEFEFVDSKKGQADITIILTSLRNSDGYTGYTTAITDENHILRASITIYEADRLSEVELGTITRHEFGHVLGLAHSTAPEDLMAPIIQTAYPFISDCDIDTLSALYDGSKESGIVCKK